MKFKMPVKTRCEKCHHAERHSFFSYFVLVMLHCFAVMGIVFAAILFLAGPEFWASFYTDYQAFNFANKYHNELRHIALNLTTFDGASSYDMAIDLATNLPNSSTRYSYPSLFDQIQDPLETYNYGGDCKNTAILFTAMMLNLGYKSRVICNTDQAHCVSMVRGDGRFKDTYMVVDLAAKEIAVFKNTQDYWKWLAGEGNAPSWIIAESRWYDVERWRPPRTNRTVIDDS